MAERHESGTFQGWYGSSKFPWDEWLDGAEWKLTYPDIDSKMGFTDFAKYAHKVAKQRGLRLRTKRVDWDPHLSAWTAMWIQAFDPYDEAPG